MRYILIALISIATVFGMYGSTQAFRYRPVRTNNGTMYCDLKTGNLTSESNDLEIIMFGIGCIFGFSPFIVSGVCFIASHREEIIFISKIYLGLISPGITFLIVSFFSGVSFDVIVALRPTGAILIIVGVAFIGKMMCSSRISWTAIEQ